MGRLVQRQVVLYLQEKGAGAPSGKDALKPGEKPKGRGFFTSAWSSAGPEKKDSPEQKKGVVTDPDIAPPKMDDAKQQTPSSKKTNELVRMFIAFDIWCMLLLQMCLPANIL